MLTTKVKTAIAGFTTALALFAFTTFKNGSIKGSVSPSAGALSAYVVSGMDTMRTNIENGVFEINEVKPGTYRLVIEAVAPYKNFEKEGVVVKEKKETDIGQVSLQQ